VGDTENNEDDNEDGDERADGSIALAPHGGKRRTSGAHEQTAAKKAAAEADTPQVRS